MSLNVGCLFLVFVKIILLNMGKKEPNFNIREISDSELVLKAAKVEQKIRKTTIKTSQGIKMLL